MIKKELKTAFFVSLAGIFISLIFAFTITTNALAAEASKREDSSDSRLSVTVYNHGQGLISEEKIMEIPLGKSRVEYSGVAETINPKTLQITPADPDFRVLDMNYEYDLISIKALLDKYLNKKITISITDPQDKELWVKKEALLVANNDRPIFKIDNQIYIGSYNSIMLPQIPEDLISRPTLIWLVDNPKNTRQKIETSYLADKISWAADYVLNLDQSEKSGSITGWATIDNKTGKTFKNANLKLVAGTLNRVQDRPTNRALPVMYAKDMAQDSMTQESLFEYHLYSLGRQVNIRNKQTKQISLLQAPRMELKKILIAPPSYGLNRHSAQGDSVKQKPNVFLTFKNTKENGMGLPLPEGIVRTYQKSSDQSTVFIGEDRINHTSVNEEVKLKLGEAFDLTVERKIADYKKINNHQYQYTMEIALLNSKTSVQEIIVQDQLPRSWRVVNCSHDYAKKTASLIEFKITVPPTKADRSNIEKIKYVVEVRE